MRSGAGPPLLWSGGRPLTARYARAAGSDPHGCGQPRSSPRCCNFRLDLTIPGKVTSAQKSVELLRIPPAQPLACRLHRSPHYPLQGNEAYEDQHGGPDESDGAVNVEHDVQRLRDRMTVRSRDKARAFSSEVATGSRKENASNKKLEPGSEVVRTGKALAGC